MVKPAPLVQYVYAAWPLQEPPFEAGADAAYLDGAALISGCCMQALCLMAQAYLTSGQPAPALQCVQNVRTLRDALGNSPALCLAALKAHLQACLTHPYPAWMMHCAAVAHECCC